MDWQEKPDGSYVATVGGFRIAFEQSRNALHLAVTDYHAEPQWLSMEDLPGGNRARIIPKTQSRPLVAWWVIGIAVVVGAVVGWIGRGQKKKQRISNTD